MRKKVTEAVEVDQEFEQFIDDYTGKVLGLRRDNDTITEMSVDRFIEFRPFLYKNNRRIMANPWAMTLDKAIDLFGIETVRFWFSKDLGK